MPTIQYGISTSISESCIWVEEGIRKICISYRYNPYFGELIYAATIFRPDSINDVFNDNTMRNHEYTTMQRFQIRPVIMTVSTYLDYDEIIPKIRYEMCHGPGCKGPRLNKNICDTESEESFASTVNYDKENKYEYSGYYQVNEETMNLKTTRKLRYFYTTKENYGNSDTTFRDIFITFKGNPKNGDLIFGACINRQPGNNYKILDDKAVKEHWKTAKARLDKCPVHMNISEDFRYQLNKNATHREDVMYEILDKIFTRRSGFFQIKW